MVDNLSLYLYCYRSLAINFHYQVESLLLVETLILSEARSDYHTNLQQIDNCFYFFIIYWFQVRKVIVDFICGDFSIQRKVASKLEVYEMFIELFTKFNFPFINVYMFYVSGNTLNLMKKNLLIFTLFLVKYFYLFIYFSIR